MKNISRFIILSLVIVFVVASTGCSAINTFKDHQQTKRDTVELKKENYLALKHDISNNALLNQATSLDVKEKYGPPDDIFYSNSNGRSFQIWTYNMSQDRLDNTGDSPIILYLENDKLISWKY